LIEVAKNVLVLAAHVDDGELGCGGAIARLTEAGATVHYAAFSICEESVPPGFERDVLAGELRLAVTELGILPENLIVKRYSVRHLPQHRQAILEEMVDLQRTLSPDVVFLPCSDDVHQDHQVVNQEGTRAFKRTTVLGYELPWNNLQFRADALVVLQERHLAQKLASIRQYRSQGHRRYMSDDLMMSLARIRGEQAGTEFAEAFQVIRWLTR